MIEAYQIYDYHHGSLFGKGKEMRQEIVKTERMIKKLRGEK